MPNTIFKKSISASVSCIKSYFKENNINSSALTFLRPIAITSENNPAGWIAKEDRTCLLDIVSKEIGKSIRILDFDNSNAIDINAFVVEKQNSADIYVKKESDLNFCSRRFVVAKELNHLLMNKVDSNLQTIVYRADFIDLVSFLTLDSIPKDDSQKSENIAYYGAMELLIPQQYFESDWFKSQKNNYNDIALQLRCPTQVIELRKGKGIQKQFSEIYESL